MIAIFLSMPTRVITKPCLGNTIKYEIAVQCLAFGLNCLFLLLAIMRWKTAAGKLACCRQHFNIST
jgi:hypothetical protein